MRLGICWQLNNCALQHKAPTGSFHLLTQLALGRSVLWVESELNWNLFSLDSALLTYRVPFANINFISFSFHSVFSLLCFFWASSALLDFAVFLVLLLCLVVVVESFKVIESVCLICLKLRQQHFMHVSKLETICDLLAHDLII